MSLQSKSGVSVKFLRALAQRSAEGASTQEVIDTVIRPGTASKECPYIEIVPDEHRGPPVCVAVHAWSANFRALVNALAQALPGEDESTIYVWIDVLVCNQHSLDDHERLDAASHAATAVTDAAASATGPPSSVLGSYTEAILTVLSSPAPSGSPSRQPGFLAVVVDANAAVLASPWCLYGIWLCLRQAYDALSPSKATAAPVGAQLQSRLSTQLGDTCKVLCTAGLDALLVQIAWENLSLLQTAPNISENLQSLIVEDVASDKPLPLPFLSGSATTTRTGTGTGDDEQDPDVEARIIAADEGIKYTILTSLEQRVQALVAASGIDKQPSTEPATAAVPPAAPETSSLAPEPGFPLHSSSYKKLPPIASFTAALPSPTAAPTPAPAATAAGSALTEALAAASDVYGCLIWAAGRPIEGQTHLRRALQLRLASAAAGATAAAAATAAATGCSSSLPDGASSAPEPSLALPGPPETTPGGAGKRATDPWVSARTRALLASHATLHLAALLHVLPYTGFGGGGGNATDSGDEAERMLRVTLTALEATGPGGDGGAGIVKPSLLAAQARHFLAQLIGLRAAAVAAAVAAGSSSNSGGSGGITNGGGGGAKQAVGLSEDGLYDRSRSSDGSGVADGSGGFSPPLYGSASMQLPSAAAAAPLAAEVAQLLAAALPVFEKVYGSDHALTATLRCNLGQVLKAQGRLAEAEPLLRRAVSVRQKLSGPAHPDTLRAVHLLAGLAEEQGNLFEAESLLRSSAEAAAARLGPDAPHTATALTNLGLLLRKAGKFAEAAELFSAALDLRERQQGPASLATAACLEQLAGVLRAEGREAAAEPLLRRILDIRELVLGPGHPATAASLAELAGVLAGLGRWGEAEPLMRRAVSVHSATRGAAHSDTAAASRELARVLAVRGRLEEAEGLYRSALKVMDSTLGPEHPETVATVNQLALLLKDRGPEKGAEAEALFLRVLSLSEPFGPAPPPSPAPGKPEPAKPADTAAAPAAAPAVASAASTPACDLPAPLTTITATAAAAATTAGSPAASPTVTSSPPPPPHPALTLLKSSTFHSATAAANTTTAANATTTFSSTTATATATFTATAATLTSPTTAAASPTALRPTNTRLRRASLVSLRGLAELAAAKGRLDTAEELCCRLLVGSEAELGPVHPSTLDSAEMLAAVLREQAMYEDAMELYARLMETAAEELGRESTEAKKYLGLYEETFYELEDARQERERMEREDQQQQELEQQGGGGGSGDDDDDDGLSLAASSTAATIGRGRTPSVVHNPRNLRALSGTSAVTSLLGSFVHVSGGGGGGGRAVRKPSPSALRRRAAISAAAADGGGDGDDLNVKHSFASFVGRRASHGGRSEARSRIASFSRAQSIVVRVHSSLIAAGRISTSGGGGGGGAASGGGVSVASGAVAAPYTSGSRRARFHADGTAIVNDVTSGGGGGAAAAAVPLPPKPPPPKPRDGTDGAVSALSPGLPDMGPEAAAAKGAASVSLDKPPPSAAAAATAQAIAVLAVTPLPPSPPKGASRDGLTAAAAKGGDAAGGGGGGRTASGKVPLPPVPVATAASGRRSWAEAGEDLSGMPYGRRKSSGLPPRVNLSRQMLLKEAQNDISDDDGGEPQAALAGGAGRTPSGQKPTTRNSNNLAATAPRGVASQGPGPATATTAAATAAAAAVNGGPAATSGQQQQQQQQQQQYPSRANTQQRSSVATGAGGGGAGGGGGGGGGVGPGALARSTSRHSGNVKVGNVGMVGEEEEPGAGLMGCCGLCLPHRPKVVPSPRGAGAAGGAGGGQLVRR